MPDTIEEATAAVQTAREAHEEAQARRAQLRERVDALEDEAHNAERELKEAHREGADPGELKAIRRRRTNARSEARELREELEIVDGVVEEARQAVEAAEQERALARSEVLLEEARERGTELHELLEEVVERYEEIQALDNTHERVKSTLRRTGYDGPGPGHAKEAAGVHNLRSVLSDIPRALQRDRARRG